ncbi:SNF1-interacting protein [Mortierella sp. GBA30]|nr:SNF1-interacting protein [Mortierella sp. GBA30]
MGNTSAKEKTDHVDGGALLPNGIYTGPQDYDFRIVQRLIIQRKLAPFYKGLEDWDDNEDAQEEKEKQQQLLQRTTTSTAATTKTTTTPRTASSSSSSSNSTGHSHSRSHSGHNVARGNNSSSSSVYADRHLTESEREKRRLYQGAIECPICFLYYPRNINRTRCCDKPMCTECFVQLKRLESAPTESPACPYCVEPHFGVIYSSALLPSGLMSPLSLSVQTVGGTSMSVSSSSNSIERSPDTQNPSSPSTRRRSTSHKSPEVVSADELRPDWNRRILAAAQRQAGSRRASTSSSMTNATFALGRRLAVGRQTGSGSRRSNSSAAAADYNGYLSAMRSMGADLEELMIMEAMRQSLQDEHDRQTREAAAADEANATGASSNSTTTTYSEANPRSRAQSRSGEGGGHGMGTEGGSRDTNAPSSSTEAITPSPSMTRGGPATSSSTMTTTTTRNERSGETGNEMSSSSSTSEPESDQDESPAILQNRAIRYAPVTIPARSTPVESAPKHLAQDEPAQSSSEAV